MNTLVSLLVGFVAALILAAGIAVFWKRRRGKHGGRHTSIHSSIEQLKAIGQLSVFKVLTKEIVTESDHLFGEIGKKYLSWILTNKKLAMIFQFEIDFRYDLQSPDFQIVASEGRYIFRMPPCLQEISIRDIQFYDEQNSKLVPLLVPDILNRALGPGFTEQDKNRLKDAARNAAESQAKALIGDLGSEVEQSAMQTLRSLARGFGEENVQFEFSRAQPETASAVEQEN